VKVIFCLWKNKVKVELKRKRRETTLISKKEKIAFAVFERE